MQTAIGIFFNIIRLFCVIAYCVKQVKSFYIILLESVSLRWTTENSVVLSQFFFYVAEQECCL